MKMKYKALLGALAIFGMFLVMILTEEKQDYKTEEIYWKKDIHELQYAPPSEEWNSNNNQNYIKKSLTIKRLDKGGFSKLPFFIIETKDSENGNTTYEAGFNAKNLFTELSVLKINTVLDSNPSYLKEYKIEDKSSPTFSILESKEPEQILLGKELNDKTAISFAHANYILTTKAHTFRRFQAELFSFRERQLVNVGTGFIQKIRIKNSAETVEIENSPSPNEQGGRNNSWRRNTGTRLVFAPNLGDELDSAVKSLRYDLFPDEPNGASLEVANELTKSDLDTTIEVWTSDGFQYKILLFPKTSISEKDYRPVLRTVVGLIEESPAYVNNDTVSRLINIADRIRKAEKWQRPEKQIK
ncbi:DUF4340 domain-containing protein [Leptospira sp. GIMC2001]|uniref:DUF4340 domain-containing protein n=1 Tax=Leptospira sp. GIMC2001 TaxID=1513297 RepID=UPI00234A7530|nr:DUF4340 domain-containing protein [Leptospira sp. GIMC2001]WCL50032.1 DUF4340 domain-containing protein [Leptospira sp. GIMC2001]